MGDQKSLCKWGRKRIGDELAAVSAIVCQPTVVCSNCGRAVCDERFVCRPVPLAELAPAPQRDTGGKASKRRRKAEEKIACAEKKVAKAQRRLAKARSKAGR